MTTQDGERRPPDPRPAADVLLADGRVAVIRALEPQDREGLDRLHADASDSSIRFRFFAPSRTAGHDYVARLFSDHPAVECLVALVEGRIIAVATAERDPRPTADPASAEVAFLVADDLHGRGLGSLLLEHLAARGRDRGIRRFTAEVLSDNRAMIGVFLDAGFELTRSSNQGITDLVMSTSSSSAAVVAADQRERRAEARSLQPLLSPTTVAVVGARRDGTGVGAAVLQSIVAGGYEGLVVAVHPQAHDLDGVPAYRRLVEVPRHLDVVVVAVPPADVLAVVEDAVAAEASTLVVLSSGFGETGEHGAALQRRVARLARAHSIRLVGPNCLGVMVNHPDIRLNATFTRHLPPTGGLAVASQSGGVGIALLDVATRLGLGVGTFLSLGNKADVSGNDLLAAWMDDPRVSAAALYLESFGNAPKFARVARTFAERKPLLAVVGGRSVGGSRAGSSHTAAAATPAAGVDALFAQSGVIGCHGAEDLAETALLLAEQPLPTGPRVGVVTNAGGMGVLAADALEEQGLVVPELSAPLRSRLMTQLDPGSGTGNPVDLGAAATPAALAAALGELAASDEVDAVLVILVATSVVDPQGLLNSVAAVAASSDGSLGLPLVLVPMGGLDVTPGTHPGVTFLPSMPAAAGALARARTYAAWLGEPREPLAPTDEDRAARTRQRARELLAVSRTGGWLAAAEVGDLLAPYGLAPDGDLAASAATAADVAARIGFPVAVKVADPEVLHKTDRGLVHVDLRTAEEVVAAVQRLEVEMHAAPVPVLVQPMARGVELALGIVRDPGFGPLVMVAAGGVATDVWDDRAFLLPPVGPRDAARVVRSLRISPLLDGYRGEPPADVAALERLVVSLGQLAVDVAEVAELDLNPVVVSPDGAVLVDVKVRLKEAVPGEAGRPRQLRSPG